MGPLLLVVCCSVGAQMLFPASVRSGGKQAWFFEGRLEIPSILSSSINGSLWMEPSADGTRVTQTMTMEGQPEVLWLGLTDDTTGHYLQGITPSSGPSCRQMGCGTFDELLNCTSWKPTAKGMLSQTCLVNRICGAGEGATGSFVQQLQFDAEQRLVGMNATTTVATLSGDQTTVVWWKLASIAWVDAPPNKCF